MNSDTAQLLQNLNHKDPCIRLDSLRRLADKIQAGELQRPETGNDVNNHIHTTFSFSPYSPAKAVWMAYQAGLATAGIMDHDSISGAEEFIEAGKIVGVATTIGVECRVDFSNTPLKGRRINNPDQDSVAYVALHGIPHTQIKTVQDYFKPYRKYRNNRNRKMVEKINELTGQPSLALDFGRDVIPLSQYNNGGSITERHILYALSLRLIQIYGKGQSLIDYLENNLKLNISKKIRNYLSDESNPHYDYDLLGLLKGEMVASFYIDATDECPDVRDIIALSEEIGAISAYAYLGDVGDSVTGDKKPQKFEDDYLDELFDVLKNLKFNAVTYMPSRNTHQQLDRVRALCQRHGFFQISGEDINSSRQSFICLAMRDEKYRNLFDSTWALIGHELAATEDQSRGLFSKETIEKYPDLEERIKVYKNIGLSRFRDNK
ncbi:MAG TPA: PHP domain-containing protein [Clostridiales bacterium]|nr:PHP domain-containing protein [Clostridiales bacterium]